MAWYVICKESTGHRLQLYEGQEEAIACACKLIGNGQEVTELGQVGGAGEETIDAAEIKRLYAKRKTLALEP